MSRPPIGILERYCSGLPAKYWDVSDEQTRDTPGIRKLGGTAMTLLGDLGRLNRRSLVKPKRKPCMFFKGFYLSRGKEVSDIPTYRNADFSGEEAYSAFAKYAHPEPTLTSEQAQDFDMACSWMKTHFWPSMAKSRVLTFEEVLAGTDQSGSPGFPWNQYNSTCDQFVISDDYMYVEKYWQQSRKSLDGAFCVWNSFLKEELRKISKIEAGDIRQINGCPVEFKLAMNRYCLDMNERFYRGHLQTASCVGVNKFRGGWNRVYGKLAAHPVGLCADVKKWDSHYPRMLFEAVRDFRFECLDTKHQTRTNWDQFKNLYEQIIRSPTILSWGEVLETRLGNPSGSPNTVVDNTLGLFALVAYCWIRSCRAQGHQRDYVDFCDNVRLCLYGDDNTYSGSPRGMSTLSAEFVKRFSMELGFEVKFEHDEPQPIEALDFLSSRFYRVSGDMVVPIPLDSNKAIASMAFRGDGTALGAWSRACAHRINSFFDRSSFRVADDFCWWLRAKLNQAHGNSIEWMRAQAEFLSESDIFNLYTGAEQGRTESCKPI